MSNPKRWIDDGASDGVRELILAAIEEQPSAAGREQTLFALGVGGAVASSAAHTAAAGSAAGAAKSATFAGTLSLLKWGVVGVLSGLTTLGAVQVALEHAASKPDLSSPIVPKPIAFRPSVADGRAAQLVAAQPTTTIEIIPPTALAPASPSLPTRVTNGNALGPTPIASSRDDARRMLEEVSRIDRARSALASGDLRGTLAALDSYEASFPERRFEPEALYLRMEALRRLGDLAGARTVARRLVTTFPSAPQSARAKAVLSSP